MHLANFITGLSKGRSSSVYLTALKCCGFRYLFLAPPTSGAICTMKLGVSVQWDWRMGLKGSHQGSLVSSRKIHGLGRSLPGGGLRGTKRRGKKICFQHMSTKQCNCENFARCRGKSLCPIHHEPRGGVQCYVNRS